MMPSLSPQQLLHAWHEQQRAYIEHRDARTECIVEVLRHHARDVDGPLRVLDLGCGPGSLANAITEGIGNAHVTGVDLDPVTLRLFRETASHPDRTTIIHADLTHSWASHVGSTPFHAAVSATALHWLSPADLTRLYADLAPRLAPGGIVLNADHLDFPRSAAWCAAVADASRARAEHEINSNGAMSWDEWWAAAGAQPGWDAEVAEHERLFAESTPPVKVDVPYHLAAMRAAGFTETEQVWQWLDDRIVLGRLPRD